LDGVAADAGRPAPHQNGLSGRRGVGCRIPQPQLIFLEQAAGRGGDGQRQHSGVLERHGVRNRGGHPLKNHGVLLKRTLGSSVGVLVDADRVRQHPVADPETSDCLTNLDHLARDVGTQHGRVIQPAVRQAALDLDDPVQRVDRDGAVANHDLVVAGRGVRGVAYLQLGVLGVDVGRGVGGHGWSP